jgi:hypothetical protein
MVKSDKHIDCLTGGAFRDDGQSVILAFQHEVSIATAKEIVQAARATGPDGCEDCRLRRPCRPVCNGLARVHPGSKRKEPPGKAVRTRPAEKEGR